MCAYISRYSVFLPLSLFLSLPHTHTCLSLSFSFSLTHTNAHTYTQTHTDKDVRRVDSSLRPRWLPSHEHDVYVSPCVYILVHSPSYTRGKVYTHTSTHTSTHTDECVSAEIGCFLFAQEWRNRTLVEHACSRM